MKNKFLSAMSLALILAMLFTSVGMASSVDVAVVDVTAPTGSVTLAPGATGPITINMTVTGNQAGTATFEVNRDWTLSGGVFTGSNPQQFTVNPRAAQDPATTFSTTGTITVANGQGTGTFTLAVSTFDITNSNTTGAKLADGADGIYHVTVSAPVNQDQTINVTQSAPATAAFGSTFNISATGGGSGNPVVIAAGGSCSGGGNNSATITMNASTGTCIVTYNQAGASGYNAAPQVTNTTTAQKAVATLTVKGYTGNYDGAAHGASGSATGVGGADLSAQLSLGSTFTDVPGGTAHWTFTGGANYTDQSGDVAIVINKALAGCTVSGYTGAYDAAQHGATGSCTGVGTLDLGAKFTDAPGGTAHWTFTAGNGNYSNDAGDVAITISKADAVCTVNGFTGSYDGTAHGATGSCKGVGGVDLSASLSLGATYTNVPGGNAHWSFAGGTNYNDQSGDVAITINKAAATCSITGFSGKYDTLSHGASGTCSGINGEAAGTLDLGASFTNAPGGTAHWVFTGNGNYGDQSGDVSINISKADATCTVSGYSNVYDAAAHGATGSCSGINGEEAGTLDLGASFTNVPGGTAHWTFTGNGNYNDQSGDVNIAISKADASCSITGYSGVYDTASYGATGSCSGIGGENAGTLNLGANFKDVPGGTAHWIFTGNGNYNNQSGDAAVVITKADATCSVTGYTGVYDAASHSSSGSCSGIGGESAGSLSLGNSFKNVPGGTAHWIFTGNGNYKDQSGDAAVVITKADATCSVSGYIGVYDATAHGATGSCSGIGGEDAGTLNLGTMFTDVPGGTVHWTFTGNGNYNDQANDVNIAISKATSSVAVTCGGPYTYSGLAQTPCTASATGVGLSPIDVSSSLVYANNTSAGNATANANWTGDNNHFGSNGSGGFTINKANAVCTVTGYIVYFDNVNHTATGSCKGVLNEVLAGLDLSATTHKLVGTYNDTWTFTDATGNYNNTSGIVVDTIVAWTLKGFYQPVDMNNVYNVVKNGSTVPLKFEIFAGTTELTDVAYVKSLTYAQTSCDANAITDDIETTATGNTVLRYDSTSGQFVYNWKTPSTAGKCYRVTMTTIDGSTLVAYFKLK